MRLAVAIPVVVAALFLWPASTQGLDLDRGAEPGAPDCPPQKETAAGLYQCGKWAMDHGRLRKGERWLTRALELAELPGVGRSQFMSILFQRSRPALERNDWAGVVKVYRQGIATLDETLDAKDPARVDPLLVLSAAVAQADSEKAALPLVMEAVAIAELHATQQDGRDLLASSLAQLGGLHLRLGQAEPARVAFRRVADLYRWEPHERLIGVAERLARLEVQSGDVEAGGRAYMLAMQSYLQRYGPTLQRNSTDHEKIGLLVQELKDLSRRTGNSEKVGEIDSMLSQFGVSLYGKPVVEATKIYKAGEDEGIDRPEILHKIQPVYPEQARRERSDGNVMLTVIVREDGRVASTEVRRCNQRGLGFEEAAQQAVRQWVFEPTFVDGRAVTVSTPIFVDFKLR